MTEYSLLKIRTRHQTAGGLVVAEWDADGADERFALLDDPHGQLKGLPEIADDRLRALATDLLALPGVGVSGDESSYAKAAFVISRNEIIVNVPEAEAFGAPKNKALLDDVERGLMGVLSRFFGSVHPAEETGRVYEISVVDGRVGVGA